MSCAVHKYLFNLLELGKRLRMPLFPTNLGYSASIVSIYRITRIPELASPDFTYETSDLVIWNW